MSTYAGDWIEPLGELVDIGQPVRAFVPAPLPRRVRLDEDLTFLLDQASRSVAELSGLSRNLAAPQLLLSPLLRREAVLSSRIEGTQASLADLYAFEVGGKESPPDTREVSNYVRALEMGVRLLDELPLCVRLVHAVHAALLEGVRGADQRPGETRNLQVWIGAEGTPIEHARFVPPPPALLPDLLADWEAFLNEDLRIPPLIQCALMHYQFEAIHPYRDGNGRVGRLLISLFLAEKRVLAVPLLYLSAYFERFRDRYYDELRDVSRTSRWEGWLTFFLTGVHEQAQDAMRRVGALNDLRERYRRDLQAARASGSALRLVDDLFIHPITTVRRTAESLDVTQPAARKILSRLASRGLLRERETFPRLYIADEILAAIE